LRKTLGRLPEEVLDLLGVHLDLLLELVARVQERQRVVVGLAHELAAPRLGQLLEQVDHVRA
jgi:hypothetical protein